MDNLWERSREDRNKNCDNCDSQSRNNNMIVILVKEWKKRILEKMDDFSTDRW